MANSDKNKPASVVLIGIAVIAAMIIFYAIIMMFFPDLFHGLSNATAQPVKTKP